MSLAPTLWLVELRSCGRPVGLYLHAFEGDPGVDAGTEWDADASRALRFATKAAADEHIRGEIGHDAVAALFAPADLVAAVDHDLDEAAQPLFA